MLATAVNPTVGLLSGRAKFPVNRGKFPVLREFRRAPRIFAAFCCISGAELRNIKGLALIFSGSVRGCAHAREGHAATAACNAMAAGAVRAMLRFHRLWQRA